MYRLPRRLAFLSLALITSACVAPAAIGSPVWSPAVPVPTARASAPAPTPGTTPTATARPTTSPSATKAPTGDTAAASPDVSVEPLGDGRYRVTVTDRHAKAWRVDVRGIEELAGAVLSVVVETNDLEYSVSVDRRDVGDPSPTETPVRRPNADPICLSALHACLAPKGVRTPDAAGAHTIVVGVQLDPGAVVEVVGGAASWPDEPFVLGPWRDAEGVTLGG